VLVLLLFSLLLLFVGGGCALLRAEENYIQPTMEQLFPLVRGKEDNETLLSFVAFASKYGKTYPSQKEMLSRLAVFKDRVANARELDEASRKMGSTARYGVTTFSDLTLEEFKERYLMKNMPTIPKEKLFPFYQTPNTSISSLRGPPAAFDWNNHPGTVTGVYNQERCGSCWAFSATENHESRFARQHHKGVEGMSVQQILDCDDPGRYGCNGGWPHQAWEYIHSQGGQDRLDCYPYAGHVQQPCRYKGGCNAGGVGSWSWIFPHDEHATLMWLWGNAPVSICVDASQWSSYSGGVVEGSQCGRNIDHCVLLTGWDMNSNPPYWNVRNSWGTGWGSGGYIMLAYNQNTCGMADYPASCHT